MVRRDPNFGGIRTNTPLELAELIADAYQLTQREREVVRLLAIGHRPLARASGDG